MTPPEGVFVVFSAGAKQTALDRLSDDDSNPNSVFTRNFVRRTGKTRTEPGADRQADPVRRPRHDGRCPSSAPPAYYDQIVGDVVLNGAAPGSSVNEPSRGACNRQGRNWPGCRR